ncbi:MAG: hypothetical protein JKY70_18000 [Mucilaginibacter sp.]|nr:hypothetical protein [Mucilaginibacter sp.]
MKREPVENLPEKPNAIYQQEEDYLLNLIVELITEIIIKETTNERDRLRQDQ